MTISLTKLVLTLPFPPSVNNYYRTNFKSKVVHLSTKGRQFKDSMISEMKADLLKFSSFQSSLPLTERLSVTIDLYADSYRKYDIDNRIKACLDSLEGTVYLNDNQIDELIVRRQEVDKENSRCLVTICVMNEQSPS
jgi:crossover junction endodeoxyribonuclease RusA